MDIDHIQKINTLALDLLKQGLAKDRQDAVEQAERAYRSQSQDYKDMRQTMDAVQSEGRPKAPGAEPELPTEKVREILQQNTQFLVKTIKEFQEQLQALKEDVAGVKTNMSNFQLSVAAARNAPQRGEESRPAAGTKVPENHPRTGNYKDTEVSIEKFFYAGKK